MESAKTPVALYDYLYKDNSRIASYYAQLFKGRLTSFEQSDSVTDTDEDSGKISIKVAEGTMKVAQQTQTGTKRVLDPHEIITNNVLSHFIQSDMVNRDVVAASHGEIVMVQGTLAFIDELIMETAITAWDFELSQVKTNKLSPQEKLQHEQAKVERDIIRKFKMPSAFILSNDDGSVIGGIIKESGMEETITSYYVKHGAAGLAGIHMIGVKEVPSPIKEIPVTHLFGVGQQIAQHLSRIIFPESVILVTPFALFRAL